MPKSEATIKVHLTQIRKHTLTTTTNKNIGDQHTRTDPIQEQNNGKKELDMDTMDKTQKIYTYQTGKFSMAYSRGNTYVTGYIPRCPLRSHSMVCIKNHLFIVGIGPILNKELEFIF